MSAEGEQAQPDLFVYAEKLAENLERTEAELRPAHYRTWS